MGYEPGDRIGDYQILDVLGAGGMGKVYKVRNTISDRVEAMKILLPNLAENAELGERFVREIKLQATLSHPNIATLHTAMHFENQLLMLMEFVDGMTLDTLVQSGPLRLEEAVNYMAQVCDALSYAHAKGIIHRDLKPANMMLTPEGSIKLLDFGIAKMVQDRSMTKTGFMVGSLPYISPEQIEGAHDIDGRTDIYSLGITLYQLVTGRVPFQADSEYSLMRKHLQEAPLPPLQVMPDVPQGLNDIIMQAIEKDRNRRFQSATAMAAALRSITGAPAAAYGAPPGYAPPPPPPPAEAAWGAQPAPAPEQAWGGAPPPPIPEARKPSHRGLYVALGAVLAVAVLIVGATQLPKFFGAKASAPGGEAAQQQPPAQAPQQGQEIPSQPTATGVEPAQPVSQPATEPASQPARPAVQRALGGSGGLARRAGGARPLRSELPATQTEPAAPAAQPAGQAAVPAQPPAGQQNADAEALGELRERLMLLGARVNSVHGSLNRMKQEQARMGLGLRGDISASAQRLEFYMDEAEAAVKRGDAAAAKKQLDSAERETSKLEKFLGR